MTCHSTSNGKTYVFKTGATFCPSVQFIPVRDGLQNLSEATVTCMVMDSIGTRHSVTATVNGDGLTVQLEAPATETINWAIGSAFIDLRYVIGGNEELTDTLTFAIEEGITLQS